MASVSARTSLYPPGPAVHQWDRGGRDCSAPGPRLTIARSGGLPWRCRPPGSLANELSQLFLEPFSVSPGVRWSSPLPFLGETLKRKPAMPAPQLCRSLFLRNLSGFFQQPEVCVLRHLAAHHRKPFARFLCGFQSSPLHAFPFLGEKSSHPGVAIMSAWWVRRSISD